MRPTTDRMRERLFSILNHHKYPDIDGARVADVFAGTGALGLEALSRGAAHVTFVEMARASQQTIRDNIRSLDVGAETKLLSVSATKLPKPDAPFDFVFMDPPYRQNLALPALASLDASGWLKADSVIVCELASDEATTFPDSFDILDDRTQGQQRIVILSFKPLSD